MSMNLMYITRDPGIAKIAQASGVDWIFVDLEIIGKHDRQGHLDTVISGHTLEDVRAVRAVLDTSKLLVRVNPIHSKSPREIDDVIEAGADIVMLPFFHHRQEVAEFVEAVGGRAKTCLLLETPGAVEHLDEILTVEGIDYVHIGLNDLHLGYGLPFMFDLLANGTVEHLMQRLAQAGLPCGFGGIARLGHGDLPAEAIIAEHHRMGSSMAILSRSFCMANSESDLKQIEALFLHEVARIRAYEEFLTQQDEWFFEDNRMTVGRVVGEISARRAAAAAAKVAVAGLTGGNEVPVGFPQAAFSRMRVSVADAISRLVTVPDEATESA
ncbi:aldolase/citrate lyase family protein [Aestuariimicrobium sp. Y1814]|uniref:aldolase/citrate lyase family protein n=1 Tax=Aestuariimicrobium sp. Y1814 TaxID=3418742 RepID=UPI003DA76A86